MSGNFINPNNNSIDYSSRHYLFSNLKSGQIRGAFFGPLMADVMPEYTISLAPSKTNTPSGYPDEQWWVFNLNTITNFKDGDPIYIYQELNDINVNPLIGRFIENNSNSPGIVTISFPKNANITSSYRYMRILNQGEIITINSMRAQNVTSGVDGTIIILYSNQSTEKNVIRNNLAYIYLNGISGLQTDISFTNYNDVYAIYNNSLVNGNKTLTQFITGNKNLATGSNSSINQVIGNFIPTNITYREDFIFIPKIPDYIKYPGLNGPSIITPAITVDPSGILFGDKIVVDDGLFISSDVHYN